MNFCQTCKYWATEPRDAFEKRLMAGLGRCDRTPQFWDVSDWTKDSDGPDYTVGRAILPQYADRKAFVQDGSDYHADLLTRHDFGCVMHELKQPLD